MGSEHSPDTVWRAQELYCVDRLSYAKVAELTNVSATTLKAWGQKFDWAGKREEIAHIEAEIRMDTIRSRKKALSMLLQSGDGKECSQMAFAVSSLETLALKQQELIAQGKISAAAESAPKLTIESKQDAVSALTTAVEKRLAHALQNPEAISSNTVQDIVRMLKIMDDLRAEIPGDEVKASHGVSKDMAALIREALQLS